MKPIEFKEQNTVYAKNQAPYLPLPVFKVEGGNGEIISCWELSFIERIKLLFTGKLWWTQLAFGQKLQPQRPSVHKWDTLDKEYFKNQ